LATEEKKSATEEGEPPVQPKPQREMQQYDDEQESPEMVDVMRAGLQAEEGEVDAQGRREPGIEVRG
jgi:hypothetical protein